MLRYVLCVILIASRSMLAPSSRHSRRLSRARVRDCGHDRALTYEHVLLQCPLKSRGVVPTQRRTSKVQK